MSPRLRPASSLLRRFQRFWDEDRGLTVLLLVLVLVILAGGPLGRPGALGRTFLSVVLTLALGTGVLAVSRKPWMGLASGCVAAVAVALEWLGQWSAAPWIEAAGAICTVACLVLFATVVFHQVLRKGRITVHRVVGSATAYLLLGFAWGELYRALYAVVPGSLASSSGAALERPHFIYFSIVTLTTLGYGDITPVHPFARSLAMLEALTGQLFPAILIARLVSMELMAHER